MDALARSINTVAIRLAQIDGVSRVVEMARRMGISTPHLLEDLSLALGTASVTPLEMCSLLYLRKQRLQSRTIRHKRDKRQKWGIN